MNNVGDTASLLVLGSLSGSSLTPEEKKFLKKEKPSGLTLFGRNMGENLGSLVQETKDLIRRDFEPLIAIDQEGGRVARLKPPLVPNLGPALGLFQGKRDPETLQNIRDYALDVARSLREFGINVNFAPVVDCLTEKDNACIGDRAFATDPQGVALRGGAFLDGLTQGGVLGCLKHFPGQGHGRFDTHLDPCLISRTRSELLTQELHPFRELMDRCPMIMTSHAIFSALDPIQPASLSRSICHDLLREELHYGGVLVSDDLTMAAISQDETGWLEAVIGAIEAGCDMILVCQGLDRWVKAIEEIRKRQAQSPWFTSRVEEALLRIRRSVPPAYP
jgi:beta-N-acetylhexosaminidase